MILYDNQYFANINYYKSLFNTKNIVLPTNLMYQKGWFNNKCSIVGANGIINLSVPLLGGRDQKTKLKDVKIAYHQNWQLQHLRAIASCYGNAPYFNHYYPFFQKLYSTQFESLFEINIYVLENVVKFLKSDIKVSVSDTPIQHHEIIFTKKNIAENPLTQIKTIKYPQVFEDRLGFVPNLSIIDLLMCMGPQSKNILLQLS